MRKRLVSLRLALSSTLLLCVLLPAQAQNWTPTGSLVPAPAQALNTARLSHTATLLADGKVLVSGGYGVGSPAAWRVVNSTIRPPAYGAAPED